MAEEERERAPSGKLAMQRLASYFDSKGVDAAQRVRLLQELLDLSYASARRRLIGESDFSLDDLDKIARHHGDELSDVVMGGRPAPASRDALGSSAPGTGEQTRAILRLSPHLFQCSIRLHEPVTSSDNFQLVATREMGQWHVVPITDAADAEAYTIQELVVDPHYYLDESKRLAILDDDEKLLRSFSRLGAEAGFDVHSFSSHKALLEAYSEKPFDAYVLDWLVGGATSRAMIADIRGRDALCPIVVLTGQVDEGTATRGQLRSVAEIYSLYLYEKPTDWQSIATTLKTALSALTAPTSASAPSVADRAAR
jgi:FixJ family two-component response regulator